MKDLKETLLVIIFLSFVAGVMYILIQGIELSARKIGGTESAEKTKCLDVCYPFYFYKVIPCVCDLTKRVPFKDDRNGN